MTSVSGLPSGTVTLVFTDIEGSTRLLKTLGASYDEVLQIHNRLLREAFAAHDGHEIDTQGDSFFVAFRRARDAIAAAADGQRALANHAWPDDGTVKVRIGIHTGEPAVGDDRYVGIGVHRAARIGAAGHGGQVVLSSATHDLVEDELPADVSLRDLGRYHLKDIDRSERLYQLDIDGLPKRFPPLKAARPPNKASAFLHKPVNAAGVALALVTALALVLLLMRDGNSAQATDLGRVTADSVGVVDAKSGKVSGQAPVGASPAGLATGIGSVWASSEGSDSVSRIEPASNTVVQTIPVGRSPLGLVSAAGAVWVVNSNDGTVTRIDPSVNRGVDTVGVGNQPTQIAFGGGSLWVAVSGDQTIVRLSPVTGKKTGRWSAGAGADAVAYGNGSLWVASTRTGTVSRLNTHDGTVLRTINVGNGPAAIAAGAGAIWVANALDGTVSRVDPETNTVTQAIPVGDGPSSLAVADGAVWVTNQQGGTLARIDATTNTVTQTIPVGNRPSGVAVDGAFVYVGVRGAGAAHRGGTLHTNLAGIADHIDPATAYDSDSWASLSVVYDGLVTFKHVGGLDGATLVPDLAAALPPASDSTTYSFTLRKGIRYSSGRPVRASDFRFALERVFKLKSGGASYYTNIVGGAACADTPKRCSLARGIVTDDAARTVTFHLVRSDPEFLNALGLPFADAVPQDTPLHDVGRRPVPATGPYKVVRFVPNRLIELVRNPLFREWSAAAQPSGYPDRIVNRADPSHWTGKQRTRLVRSVESGRIDLLSWGDVPNDMVAELRTRFASQVRDAVQPGTHYLVLNDTQEPFASLAARRALAYAVDRRTLIKKLFGPKGERPTCQLLPPNFPGYRPYCPYTVAPTRAGNYRGPDLRTAKRLAAASGTRGEKVTIAAARAWGKAPARYLATVLRSLGYRPQVTLLSEAAHKAVDSVRRDSDRYDIHISGWLADWPSPLTFFLPLITCPRNSGTANLSGFCNHRIDREVAHARTLETTNPQAANALWARIDREVTNQAPGIYISNFTPSSVISKRTGNYQYSPQWGPLLSQLWVR